MSHIGRNYEKSSDWQHAMWIKMQEVLEATSLDFTRFSRALDLGCGSGNRTRTFRRVFPSLESVYAVDSSREMIEAARASHDANWIEYEVANMDDISAEGLRWRQIDAALSTWAVHWSTDKRALLDTLSEGVKENGILAISTCERLPKMLLDIDRLIRSVGQPEAEYPFFFHDEGEWRRMLIDAGWGLVALHTEAIPHVVTAGEPFLEHWFAASAGKAFYATRWSDVGKEEIRMLSEHLDARYAGEYPGTWAFEEETLFIVAVRAG